LAVVVHPQVEVETSKARAILKPDVPMSIAIEQIRRSSSFLVGCSLGDVDLVRAGLEDILVEPQRTQLFPALPAVREAALGSGALGCSFSGSGPSIFTWTTEANFEAVEKAMVTVLSGRGIPCTSYFGAIRSEGVRVHQPLEGAAL
jgi:homoserine kinase